MARFLDALGDRAAQHRRLRRHRLGQDHAAQRAVVGDSRRTSASSPSKTPPSCGSTSRTWSRSRRARQHGGQGRIHDPRSGAQRAAHAARPHRRRRVPRRRGARHAAGDEHRPRRLADDDPRQLARRGDRAPGDAGADGRPRAADARHPRADRRRRSTSSCSRRASSTARARSPSIAEVIGIEDDGHDRTEPIFEFYRPPGGARRRARRVSAPPATCRRSSSEFITLGLVHRRRIPMNLAAGVRGLHDCSASASSSASPARRVLIAWTPTARGAWRAYARLGQRRARGALFAAAPADFALAPRAASSSPAGRSAVLILVEAVRRRARRRRRLRAASSGCERQSTAAQGAQRAARRRRCSRWPTPSSSRRTSSTPSPRSRSTSSRRCRRRRTIVVQAGAPRHAASTRRCATSPSAARAATSTRS